MIKKGFTLIELLIVIAIIGILAGVVLVNTSSARSKANNARDISQLKSLKTAIDGYYATYGTYPPQAAGGSVARGNTSWIPALVSEVGNLPVYGNYNTSNGWGTDYVYVSNGTNYKLILHDANSLISMVGVPSSMMDPLRPTWAFGFWTPGGAGF